MAGMAISSLAKMKGLEAMAMAWAAFCMPTSMTTVRRWAAEPKDAYVIQDGPVVLDIEYGNKDQKQRKCQLAEDLIRFFGSLWKGVMKADSKEHGNQHHNKVLLDEVAYGKANAHALPHQTRCNAHDHGDGEKRDDAAEGRESDRKRHVTLGKLGEHIG